MKLDDVIERFRVRPGAKVRLKDYDTGWAGDGDLPKPQRKKLAEATLAESIAALAEAQDVLYASDSWSLLIILQAMDAAGKDGTIKHVMSGVNPAGCEVHSFKQPSAEELDHNFLWRYARRLPERGRIGIFNRSYYEEVLVVKIHPELVRPQRIPGVTVDAAFWEKRYEDMNHFERHLTRNGTIVLKFFLHISRDEQRERFLKRLDDPTKNWKFSPADLRERGYWDGYMRAYEQTLRATSTEWAPWHVIPANHKWVARAMVATILVQTIRSLDLRYPSLSDEQKVALATARKELEREGKD